MKTMLRGLLRIVAVLVCVAVGLAVTMGPALLVTSHNNTWFFALYIPHALTILWCVGTDGTD
jgi:hypothetical protein